MVKISPDFFDGYRAKSTVEDVADQRAKQNDINLKIISEREHMPADQSGGWYEIFSGSDAHIVGVASQTAVGVYFEQVVAEQIKAAEGTRWFAMIDMTAENPVGLVMAVQPEDGFQRDLWPFTGHLTGHANAQPDDDMQDEAKRFCHEMGFAFEPNHMGTLLIDNPVQPADDESIEP